MCTRRSAPGTDACLSSALRIGSGWLGALDPNAAHALRQWIQLSAQRVDHLVANSRFTARRIRQYWGREASVIHPPVEVQRFRWNEEREDFYLCLCRLVPYKRVDLVVEAFNRLGLPLLVVGDGPERARLEGLAGPTVTLLGRQSEPQVEQFMARCRAFVYAGLEDFGIAPVEAMHGAPVIGLGRGGLLDTALCGSWVARAHRCVVPGAERWLVTRRGVV